ncbi:hypothetical protein SCACP_07210 [Sporomusa carbonis]|uniref:ankyrin repeat domain-containing protein n=1 Tax=Sporomusa carbonis TaxID=3076075 RepID=UPI003A7A8B68
MWTVIKAKVTGLTDKTKAINLPAVVKPDFSRAISNLLAMMGRLAAKVEVKHLIYFAVVLLPVVAGLGAYYGIVNSKAKFEAANLPENQLARMRIALTADNFVKYAGRGEKDITLLFLGAGMAPDAYRENDGFTALHAAAAYGRTVIAKLLLDHGADSNVRDKEGQTALMKAVWNSHADVAAILLQKGADPRLKDINGNSIIAMAKTKNDRKVLEVLVKAGVDELKEALDKIAPPAKKAEKAPNEAQQPPQVVKAMPTAGNRPATDRTIPSATASAGEFALVTGWAGQVAIGKPVDSLYQQFGKQAVSAGEEYFGGRIHPVLRVYEQDKGQPALTVFYTQRKDAQDKIISLIRVSDERYKTGNGIGVGATLGDLRRSGTLSSIEYTDSLYAVARDTKMRYELDISADNMPIAWLNGGDTNSLPDSMKIRSILIF